MRASRAGPGPSGNVVITGGVISGVSGVPYDLARWDIPIIPLGSGSIGNNGALSGITALTTTYANCYVVVPAGAIAAGVPAAEECYFCQMSSTTAGTIFNNTLSANLNSVGAPLIPASPTAFSTTGPGAFTGVVTARVLVTITLPAAVMGINGEVDVAGDYQWVNAATNKVITTMFGGSNIVAVTQTTNASASPVCRVKNRASVSSQRSQFVFPTSSACTSPPPLFLTVNTANAVAIAYQFQKQTATESAVFEGGRVTVIPT